MNKARNNYRWIDEEYNELELTVFKIEEPKEIVIRITDGSCSSHCTDFWFQEAKELDSFIETLSSIRKEMWK